MEEFLAVLPGESSERGAGGSVAQDRDVAFFAVVATGGEEAFFEGVGEVEAGVLPDVGDGAGREEEQAAAVRRLAHARSHDLVEIVRREEAEGRFVLMLGVPGHPPGILARVSG